MPEIIIDGYPFRNYHFKGSRRQPSYRQLRLYLIDKFLICYHCGVEVIDYIPAEREALPDNSATIDHLKPRQIRKRHQVVQKVLACNRCNKELNQQMQKGHIHA